MVRKSPTKHKAAKREKLELSVLDSRGKELETVQLNNQVFDGKVNLPLIHQAVVIYLANQRKGLAATKTRGQVSGGGRKPWRQKGTGRARVGSIRSPLWRGGGITFGPEPHSYYRNLPKKMKLMALKSALNAKLKDKQIMVVRDFTVDSHKTKNVFNILRALNLNELSVQLVVAEPDNNLKLASRNIPRLSVSRPQDIHTTDVVNCKKLVVTKEALNKLQERIAKCLQ